jgi:hypothetical protein
MLKMKTGRDKTRGSSGACAAAHERAVVTVRLTLLLLVVGAALLIFDGLSRG